MTAVLFVFVGLVALGNTVLMLATDSDGYDAALEKHVFVKIALYMTFIALLVVIPWQLGAIARLEVSALPWDVWNQESQRHGNLNGVLAVVINLIFLSWVFLLPGHLYSNSLLKKTGKRAKYPYVVNMLIGLILCTPSNPIYQLIDVLGR